MGRRIDEIRETVKFLDEHQNPKINSNADSFGSLWLTVFGNATTLYNVLKTAWRCHCSLTHKTLLNLRSFIAESSMHPGKEINLIFALPSDTPHGKSFLFCADYNYYQV